MKQYSINIPFVFYVPPCKKEGTVLSLGKLTQPSGVRQTWYQYHLLTLTWSTTGRKGTDERLLKRKVELLCPVSSSGI